MRRELALAAAAVSSLIVLALIVPLALLVRTLAADRAVANGERRSQVLVPVLASFDDPVQLGQVIDRLPSDGTAVTVFLADGRAIGAPAELDDDVALARTGKAFNSEVPGGVQVLTPVATDSGTDVIRVLVPDAQRREGVASAWLVLVGLGAGLVLVATVVADRLAGAIVAPVDELATVAERLGHGDLDARVEVAGPPEIREVGHTLNRLADRIEDLLAAERESAADLSHRLRTPVTALRLDVDSLPPGEGRERLEADVDALARAVDRLITEARRPVRVGLGAATDLVATTRERLDFWSVLADEQERTYAAELPEVPCFVGVPTDDLDAVLDAIFGNVFSHTPDGTGFTVAVEVPPTAVGAAGVAGRDETAGTDREPTAGRGRAGRGGRARRVARADRAGAVEGDPVVDGGPMARLVVDDEGPGWPGQQVLERGHSGGGSTGLGLDIVRRTAEACGGTVELASAPGGGARLVVSLPVVPAPT